MNKSVGFGELSEAAWPSLAPHASTIRRRCEAATAASGQTACLTRYPTTRVKVSEPEIAQRSETATIQSKSLEVERGREMYPCSLALTGPDARGNTRAPMLGKPGQAAVHTH